MANIFVSLFIFTIFVSFYSFFLNLFLFFYRYIDALNYNIFFYFSGTIFKFIFLSNLCSSIWNVN